MGLLFFYGGRENFLAVFWLCASRVEIVFDLTLQAELHL
jgi:hypothetical protein